MKKQEPNINEQLSHIKRRVTASTVFMEYVKVIHYYDTFRIVDILDQDSQIVAQRINFYSIKVKRPSLQLKHLISELIQLDKKLDIF